MNKLIIKAKVFETGSVCVNINRPLTTAVDWKQFDAAMSKAYKKWQEKKKNKG